MELTLESALSTGAMLGHLSYILLIISMMTTRMVLLRIIVILSAFPAIAYDVFWLKDPVGLFWETLLVTVNLVQLGRIYWADRQAQLSPEERIMVSDHLRILSNGLGRRLIDTGDWIDLRDGDVLTQEGQRPDALWYVADGAVDLARLGHSVGQCGPGNFVGEMSLLEESGVASATALAAGPVRAWRLSYAKYDRLERAQPEAYGALHGAFARDMRLKLIAQTAEKIGR